MIGKDDDVSPPERDRTANRRWMIGLVMSLVFGIFGAVMALLSYMDRNRTRSPTTIYRTTKTPAAPVAAPDPSPPTPSGEAPASPTVDPGKGKDKK